MKSRLTITLSKDILSKVDKSIDGKKVRNRSHAIERLIIKSLKPKITTAVILAGGKKGSGAISPLTKIDNKTLICTMVDHLVGHGITKIIVCPGENYELIRKELGTGSRFGALILYIEEDKLLGTAGILKKVEEHVSKDDFLVVHGDVLTDIHLKAFIKFHDSEGGVATIAVKPRLSEKKFGKVTLAGNKIVKFDHKGDRGISIVNTGMYIFKNKIFNELSDKTPSTLEKDIFPKLAKRGKLSAYLFQGIWFDIARPNSLKEAKKRWKNHA